MKNRVGILLLALCLAGFTGGFVAKRMSGSSRSVEVGNAGDPVVRTKSDGGPAGKGGSGSGRSKADHLGASKLRSNDTLESLLALEDGELYRRLALWLLDATEDEIAGFWKQYAARESWDRDIAELVFIPWTRLNPHAATMAARDTESEWFAWRAWACHDPEAALVAAVAEKLNVLGSVVRGIGEFHPDWFKANIDRIPEEARETGFLGYAEWVEGGDPVAMLTFLAEHGEWMPGELIDRMVREDPWAALDWFKANEDGVNRSFGGREASFDTLIGNLGAHHPEVLAELAAREPVGARRRTMEEVLFNRLVESDLEAAVAQARATTAPRVAAERLATVGVALAQTDPEGAFVIARDLITDHPGALDGGARAYYPNGSSSWGDERGKAEELLNALVAADPARMMAMAGGGREEDGGWWSEAVAERWAREDVEGFAQWVTAQNEEVRDSNSEVVISQLLNQERFEEAMGWAMSVDQDRTYLGETLFGWARERHEEARAWLDSSPLSEAERAEFQYLFSEPE